MSTDRIVPGKWDATGKAELGLFRPFDACGASLCSNGTWFFRPTAATGDTGVQFGEMTDIVVPGDYDGDAKLDQAIWRPRDQGWYVHQSSTNSDRFVAGATATDQLVPGDYDGDGKTDFAFYRPSDGTWHIIGSTAGQMPVQTFGGDPNDRVLPGDYDGDGKTDLALWRGGATQLWFARLSTGGDITPVAWGNAADRFVPADYDGDGKTDMALFRPSDRKWWVIGSTVGAFSRQFGSDLTTRYGTAGDIAVPGLCGNLWQATCGGPPPATRALQLTVSADPWKRRPSRVQISIHRWGQPTGT